MIKITFKEPETLVQDGIIQECIFVLCNSIYTVSDRLFSLNFGELNNDYVPIRNIQSIEQVKPTDL